MAVGISGPSSSNGGTPSATALLAITTPFIQPTACASVWDLTSTVTESNGESRTLTFFTSDAANPRFATCQPSGWAVNNPAQHFSFSPAVCPSGWTYWDMGQTISIDQGAQSANVYSTALCCDSGYTPTSPSNTASQDPLACTRSFSAADRLTITATESHKPNATRAVTDGLLQHDAWHISWRALDTSSLSPPPPDLAAGNTLTSWLPGQTGDARQGSSSASDSAITGAKWFAIIGVPIVVAAVIAGVVWCWIAGRRIKRQAVTREQIREGNEAWT